MQVLHVLCVTIGCASLITWIWSLTFCFFSLFVCFTVDQEPSVMKESENKS